MPGTHRFQAFVLTRFGGAQAVAWYLWCAMQGRLNAGSNSHAAFPRGAPKAGFFMSQNARLPGITRFTETSGNG